MRLKFDKSHKDYNAIEGQGMAIVPNISVLSHYLQDDCKEYWSAI